VIKSFAFWRTWLLPLLFVISGISSGLMLLVLLLAVYDIFSDFVITPYLVYFNNFIIAIQALILGLYLWRAWASATTRESLLIMIKSSSDMAFWLGVVLAGLLAPLGLGIYLVLSPSINQTIILIYRYELACLAGGRLAAQISDPLSRQQPAATVEGDTVPLPATSRLPVSQCVKYR